MTQPFVPGYGPAIPAPSEPVDPTWGKSTIVWTPGLVNPSPPLYQNWADVEAIVNDRQGAVRLICDKTGLAPPGRLPVPATANLDGRGRLEIVGAGPLGEQQLEVADGGVIKNVREWRTIVVRGTPATVPPVQYDMDGLVVEAFDATFLYGGVSPQPLVSVGPGIYVAMLFYMSSQLRNTNDPGHAVLDVGAGSTLLFGVGTNVFGSVVFTDKISGPVGTTLQFEMDSTLPPPSFAAFLGALTVAQNALAVSTRYTPAVLANWSGIAPTSVEDALNRIAAAVGPIP